MDEAERKIKTQFHYYDFLKPALRDPAHYTSIPAGRRTGKTYNVAQWLVEETMRDKDLPGLWVDTKNANIEKYIERYFYPILGDIKKYTKWDRYKKALYLPNKNYIDFGSAERPELLEGMGYLRGVVNEAGIVLRKASLWDNTLQPMFKSEHCRVKLVGTPKGRNTFYQIDTRGRSKRSPEYSSYHFTVYDSPNWTRHEIEEIRKKAPKNVWDQEYMARFIEDAGMVFRGVRRIIHSNIRKTYKPGMHYVMGIDLARKDDFTVIIVICVETKEVVYMDRFNEVSWSIQKDRIFNAWKDWGKPEAILDSTGVGDSIYTDLTDRGMDVKPFQFTNTTKNQIVQNLAVAIENREIFIPNDADIIDELELYEFDVSKITGKVSYSAPDGYHDDIVMALCLAYELLRDPEDNVEISFA